MKICSKMLFGHNFEITRSTAYGGICSEKINNRKFAAKKEGFPCGFYPIAENGKAGIGQKQKQLLFKSGVAYTVRIWAKSSATTSLTYAIKTSYFKVHHQKEFVLLPATEYVLLEDTFTLFPTEHTCAFEITYPAIAKVELFAISVKESDSFFGMRRDVLDLLKSMNPSNLRYPGGCYAEFFHWKDGLLPVDFRPCSTDGGLDFLLPDTYGIDTHEIGIDEFIEACRYVDAEPEITVRLSDNEPQDAADWVEYCNGAADTLWGKIRSERGHPAPYAVKIWFIGNELRAFGRNGMNQDGAYTAAIHDRFVKAMKAVDATITVVASTWLDSDWNVNFLAQKPQFDWCSGHNYLVDFYGEVKTKEDIQRVIHAPEETLYPFLKNAQEKELHHVPLSFDEWNYSWGKWGSAMTGIYIAGMLHMMMRHAEELNLQQSCYFTPLNESAIRITPESASLHADGLVFALLSCHSGREWIPFVSHNANLDSIATRSETGKIQFTIINTSIELPQSLPFDVAKEGILLTPQNGDSGADSLVIQEGKWNEIPPMSVLKIVLNETKL